MKGLIRFILLYFIPLFLMTGVNGQSVYLSPTRMAVNPAGKEGYVVLSTSSALAKFDVDTEKILETIPLAFTPSSLCFSEDGKGLFVTEYAGDGKLHLLSSATGKKLHSIAVGAYPATVCVNKTGTYAYVANRFSNDLSVIDCKKQKETSRITVVREPKSLALSPDGKILAVANHLPLQSSTDNRVSAVVTLIDTENNTVLAQVPLHDGSHSLEDICFSKDGNLLFVSHILSRYQFPTTQLERGWMNTNAVSLIDIPNRTCKTTLLLDDMYQGAANPCGLAVSGDGENLYVALSGTHELMTLSLPAILDKLKERPDVDPSTDLTFLNGTKARLLLSGKGPRYLLASGGKVFVSDYFSGGLSVIYSNSPGKDQFIKLGEEPAFDTVRKGELLFADASLCFQQWQSCISCHPGTRADGLNWDLMNDGMGNPKNTKSMLFSHVTPPCMITGIRANAEIAVRAGIQHIQFATRSEADAVCIDQYLRSLIPLPSPYLEKGKLSKAARNGKKIFVRAGCQECHQSDYYTDGHKYNVSTGVEEYADAPFDTPTLREVWRTAPYLYDGRAKTIKEVISSCNTDNKHGVTSDLTEKEMEELELYILSL